MEGRNLVQIRPGPVHCLLVTLHVVGHVRLLIRDLLGGRTFFLIAPGPVHCLRFTLHVAGHVRLLNSPERTNTGIER